MKHTPLQIVKAWIKSDSEPGDPTPAGHFKTVVLGLLLLLMCFMNSSCQDQEQSGYEESLQLLGDQHAFVMDDESELTAGLPAVVYQHDEICSEFLPVMLDYLQKPANTEEEVWSDIGFLFEERYGAGTWPDRSLIEQISSSDDSSIQLMGLPADLREAIGRINAQARIFDRVVFQGEPISLLEKELNKYVEKSGRGQNLDYLYVLLSSASLYRNNAYYAWFVDGFGEPGAISSIPDWALCDTAGGLIAGGAGAAACTLGYFAGRWLREH